MASPHLGPLLGPLYAAIAALGLQLDVQQHAGSAAGWSRTDGWTGGTQLLVAHTDLVLHGLNTVIIAVGFLPFPVQTELESG